jgi:hypothetical protein
VEYDHIQEYLKAAAKDEFGQYLDKYVYGRESA